MTKETLLHKALSNQLSEEEHLIFKQYLSDDPQFADRYNYELNVKKAVQQAERLELKKKLIDRENKKTNHSPKWYWAAAAIIIFGISIIGWNLFAPQAQPGLFAANYEKFPNLVAPNTRADGDRAEAFKAYDQGNYITAFQLFNDLRDEETASFYQGICLIELGETAKAIEHFEALSFQNEYEAHRLWYLSLLYSKNNENSKAEAIWKKLAARQSVWRDKAKSLLREK